LGCPSLNSRTPRTEPNGIDRVTEQKTPLSSRHTPANTRRREPAANTLPFFFRPNLPESGSPYTAVFGQEISVFAPSCTEHALIVVSTNDVLARACVASPGARPVKLLCDRHRKKMNFGYKTTAADAFSCS